MEVAVVVMERPGEIDAIRDASECLSRALHADLRLGRFDGLAAYDLVVVQYNPFSYGKWGFAPWLPARLYRLRSVRRRPRIALYVHEPFVPMVNWRWTLMGLWQRTQLLALQGACDLVVVSIEAWIPRLRRLRPRRPTLHLPVGSTLPDMRAAREQERVRLEATEETLVVATLRTAHPSHLDEPVARALEAVAASGREVVYLALGAGAPLPALRSTAIRVEAPGRLSAGELARRLAAADLFLAPFVDGVSTRRTSLMAALQHGLPSVGTVGELTDTVLKDANDALRLVEVDDAAGFAAEVVRLAERRDEREELGRAARRLYEQRFDWPVLARQLLAAVEEAR